MKLRPTPGPLEAAGIYVRTAYDGRFFVAECGTNTAHGESDAILFAEAGTVYQETGLTPRQLAEQRAEILEAFMFLVKEEDAFTAESGLNFPDQISRAVEKARAAIAKATGGAA